MMSKLKKAAAIGAFGGFNVSAILILHGLGQRDWMTVPWGSLRSWLDLAPIEDVVAASLRSLALAIAYWIAGSSVTYAAARVSRLPSLIRATAWATLPPIRRVIDRTVAATVTTAALAAPLAPAIGVELPPPPEPIVYQLSDHGVPTPVTPPTNEPTVILPPGIGGAGYTPRPAGGLVPAKGDAAPATATNTPSSHRVVVGDNLWTISAGHLRSIHPDRDVGIGEIATYWRRVIAANESDLQSQNPNLIYPGEQILLPEPDPSAGT